MLVWPLALMAGMITPGPANLAVLTVGLGRGPAAAGLVAAGILAGDVILALAVLGAAAWVASHERALQLMAFAGSGAMIAIGIRMLRAPRLPDDTPAPSARLLGAGGGLILALANPKALMLHLSAAPLLLAAGPVGGLRLAAAGMTVAILNLLALFPYAAAALLNRSGPPERRAAPVLGRIGGFTLVVAGGLLLWQAVGGR